jgi:hypothetical protein
MSLSLSFKLLNVMNLLDVINQAHRAFSHNMCVLMGRPSIDSSRIPTSKGTTDRANYYREGRGVIGYVWATGLFLSEVNTTISGKILQGLNNLRGGMSTFLSPFSRPSQGFRRPDRREESEASKQ